MVIFRREDTMPARKQNHPPALGIRDLLEVRCHFSQHNDSSRHMFEYHNAPNINKTQTP
jgi:hypothetical protein